MSSPESEALVTSTDPLHVSLQLDLYILLTWWGSLRIWYRSCVARSTRQLLLSKPIGLINLILFCKAWMGNWNWWRHMHSERVSAILIRISFQYQTFFLVIKFTSLHPACKRNGSNRSTYLCSRTHKRSLLPILTGCSSDDLLWISRNQHARLYFGIHSTSAMLAAAFIPTLSMRLWQRFCGLGLSSLSRIRSEVL